MTATLIARIVPSMTGHRPARPIALSTAVSIDFIAVSLGLLRGKSGIKRQNEGLLALGTMAATKKSDCGATGAPDATAIGRNFRLNYRLTFRLPAERHERSHPEDGCPIP